jgi:hypothetical protein
MLNALDFNQIDANADNAHRSCLLWGVRAANPQLPTACQQQIDTTARN